MLHVNLAITKFNVQHKKEIHFEIFFTLLHVIRSIFFVFFIFLTFNEHYMMQM